MFVAIFGYARFTIRYTRTYRLVIAVHLLVLVTIYNIVLHSMFI